jgi:hypothetical protein
MDASDLGDGAVLLIGLILLAVVRQSRPELRRLSRWRVAVPSTFRRRRILARTAVWSTALLGHRHRVKYFLRDIGM